MIDAPSKDQVARDLAERHYLIDSGVTSIFRIVSAEPGRESDPDEPIKLLEVYEFSTPTGDIRPIYFGPHPPSGQHYAAEFVQIAPEELERVLDGQIPLPVGWSLEPTPYARPIGPDDQPR